MRDFLETLYDSYGQSFVVDKVLFEQKTEHQHLIIFENAMFGRVMVLDGIVQTTEKDEFVYHEMMTHVPLLAHGAAENVLIVGGGDGGILREVCKHSGVQSITQVEIDAKVVEMCREYFPGHSAGCFDDSRLNLVIDDGMAFVSNTDQSFDVIISDSTDPIGPGESLFTQSFYAACQRCLKPGGILVTQNGVAFMQLDEVETTAQRLAEVYRDWHFYHAAVPTYIGGSMTFAWATNDPELRKQSVETLERRYKEANIKTSYYTPALHAGAFALPAYILNVIGKP